MGAGALVSLAFGTACRGESAQKDDGRIAARPKPGVKTTSRGTHPLGLAEGRDAILAIPARASEGALPLLVLLHGASGSGAKMLQRLGDAPEQAGVAVLAPDSRGSTWDAIRDGFGADVAFINRALERVFDTVAVDPERIAVGGFSDGASYAVSLGLINGDLFRRVVAFSPGFVIDREPRGRPQFFISHGTADPILPIERCGRVIAASLRREKYEVTFREFQGGHEVPPAIAAEAMKWIASL
jgi:predicted esterase